MSDKGYNYHITHKNGTTTNETVYGSSRKEAEETGLKPRNDIETYAYTGKKK